MLSAVSPHSKPYSRSLSGCLFLRTCHKRLDGDLAGVVERRTVLHELYHSVGSNHSQHDEVGASWDTDSIHSTCQDTPYPFSLVEEADRSSGLDHYVRLLSVGYVVGAPSVVVAKELQAGFLGFLVACRAIHSPHPVRNAPSLGLETVSNLKVVSLLFFASIVATANTVSCRTSCNMQICERWAQNQRRWI